MPLVLAIRCTALAHWLCQDSLAPPSVPAIVVIAPGKMYNWRLDPDARRSK